jgi:predicted TIM-barrel fold metal-dependent hydrolase
MALDGYLDPPEHSRPPERAPPPGATDCHAHVFGPFERFPLASQREYTPLALPGERYLRMLDEVGFSRGVLVQGSAHGTDCRALLYALALAPERLRGVVLLTPKVTDEELEMMNESGVRGARFSQPPQGLFKGAVGFEMLAPLAPRLARLGWHAQVQTTCAHFMSLAPQLLSYGLPIVVDHLGLADVSRGVGDASFHGILRLLGEERIWLKTTPYRLSKLYPDYPDVAPFYRALLAANPERLLWGSDWPHVHMSADMPDVGHLIDLFDRWTGDETLRRQILVDNPALLYGF